MRIGRSFDGDRRIVGVEPAHEIAIEIIGPGEIAAAAERPSQRRDIEGERLFDLVEEIEGIAAFAVELVDEGDDRNVAQAADLEQFAGARLDALCRVDHHDRRIDRAQGAIGIFGKVFVAGSVEEIIDAAAIFEGHHRGDDGDPALALDAHPVGPRSPAVSLGAHLAGEHDRPAEQQQLFGQRGLARVRVGDDGESPPPRDGIRFGHRL